MFPTGLCVWKPGPQLVALENGALQEVNHLESVGLVAQPYFLSDFRF